MPFSLAPIDFCRPDKKTSRESNTNGRTCFLTGFLLTCFYFFASFPSICFPLPPSISDTASHSSARRINRLQPTSYRHGITLNLEAGGVRKTRVGPAFLVSGPGIFRHASLALSVTVKGLLWSRFGKAGRSFISFQGTLLLLVIIMIPNIL